MAQSLTSAQAASVHYLARKRCCNCDDGVCLLLEAPCPQLRSQKLICRYFSQAVLPADSILNEERRRQRVE